MTASINASTTSGVVVTSDTSGAIAIQNNGTTKLTVDSSGATIPTLSSTTGTVTTATVTTLNTPSGVLATQNGMTGIAKAWARFNASSGSIAINASFNCSSITYVAVGKYTFNFTTSMPDANYAIAGAGDYASGVNTPVTFSYDSSSAPATGSCNFYVQTTSGSRNSTYCSIIVLGN